MNIVVLKVVSVACIFVIAVLGILASYKLKKFTRWFDILSAFSGGILIATAYTHMLPEAIDQYAEYRAGLEPATVAAVPISGVQDGSVTTTALPKKKKCNHAHHNHRRLDESSESHIHSVDYPLIPFLAALSFLCLFLLERGAIIYMQNKKNHNLKEIASSPKIHDVESSSSTVSAHGHDCCHDPNVACSSPAVVEVHHEEASPECCKDIKSLEKMSELTAFALIIAVSFHAVIEGMGLGATSNPEMLLSTFIGIAVHKGLEGFAVGANLIESAVTTRRFIMYASVVCLASPLGALVGYLMTLGDMSTGLIGPILGALAVGTFIQVATMEFLPRTFAKQADFTWKALALLVGFGIMSTMPIWFSDHEHI